MISFEDFIKQEDCDKYNMLLECNAIIEKQAKEIQRLKNGYCELKVKCNNGECDFTKEEYDGMVQGNIKLVLENDRLNNIINETREEIDNWENWLETGLRKNSKKICISTAKNMLFFIKLKLEGEKNDK